MVIRTKFTGENGKSFYKKFDFPNKQIFVNSIIKIIEENLINELCIFKNFNLKSEKFIKALEAAYCEKTSFRKLRAFIIDNYYQNLSDSKIQKKFWIERGWSEDEAISKVKEIQSKNGKKFAEKLKENPDIRKTNTQLKWWTDKGYSKEEALKLLKERQKTFTLEKCIEKYGEEGINIFKNRQAQWRKSLDDRYDKHTQNQWRAKGAYVSQESLKLFKPFYEQLKNKFTCYLGLGKGENEFTLFTEDNHIFAYDFTILELKVIFEYNGEHVHPNPEWSEERWNNWRHCFTGETADTVIKNYHKKIQLAEKAGFKVVQLWSSKSFEENSKIITCCLSSLQSLLQ